MGGKISYLGLDCGYFTEGSEAKCSIVSRGEAAIGLVPRTTVENLVMSKQLKYKDHELYLM